MCTGGFTFCLHWGVGFAISRGSPCFGGLCREAINLISGNNPTPYFLFSALLALGRWLIAWAEGFSLGLVCGIFAWIGVLHIAWKKRR